MRIRRHTSEGKKEKKQVKEKRIPVDLGEYTYAYPTCRRTPMNTTLLMDTKARKREKKNKKRNKGGKEEQIPVDFSEYTDVQLAVGCG